MLRKITLTALLGLGALTGLAAPADAAPFGRHERERCREYRVYFRRDCHRPWRFAGEYRSFEAAQCEARELRHRGFEVEVR